MANTALPSIPASGPSFLMFYASNESFCQKPAISDTNQIEYMILVPFWAVSRHGHSTLTSFEDIEMVKMLAACFRNRLVKKNDRFRILDGHNPHFCLNNARMATLPMGKHLPYITKDILQVFPNFLDMILICSGLCKVENTILRHKNSHISTNTSPYGSIQQPNVGSFFEDGLVEYCFVWTHWMFFILPQHWSLRHFFAIFNKSKVSPRKQSLNETPSNMITNIMAV